MEINQLIWFGILLISAGLVWFGYDNYRRTRRWLTTAARTQGEISSVRKKVSYDSLKKKTSVSYYPTITFRSPMTGQQIAFETQVSNNSPVGKSVAVYYQPANPADARFANFFELWLIPLVCWPNGVCFMVAAISQITSLTGW